MSSFGIKKMRLNKNGGFVVKFLKLICPRHFPSSIHSFGYSMTSGEGINSWVMTKPWMSDTPIEPYTATSLRHFKLALAQAKERSYKNERSKTIKGKKSNIKTEIQHADLFKIHFGTKVKSKSWVYSSYHKLNYGPWIEKKNEFLTFLVFLW